MAAVLLVRVFSRTGLAMVTTHNPLGPREKRLSGQGKRLTGSVYICRLCEMSSQLRLSPQTIQVLDAFLEAPREWRYGYDISRDTGLKSGTLYPILMRLAEHKLLQTCWEATEAGTPPRHMYRLTSEGLRSARAHVRSYAVRRPRRAAFGGAKG